MSSGSWGIPPIINFPSPSTAFGLTSTPPGSYQFSQRNFYRDNWSGVSDDVQREVKVSPGKYEVKESRKYTVDPPQMNALNRFSGQVRQTQKKKKPAIDTPKKRKKSKMAKSDNPPSAKVNMEIYLERFKTGVFVTKVRVGKRVQWQDVRYEKQALRYHPAIKSRQTVMSAVDTLKNYKTLQISLTKDEAERYKAGDLLEGINKPKAKPKSGAAKKQVNNYYQTNHYVYNAGPSTSTHCIEDYSESDSYSSDYSTDD